MGIEITTKNRPVSGAFSLWPGRIIAGKLTGPLVGIATREMKLLPGLLFAPVDELPFWEILNSTRDCPNPTQDAAIADLQRRIFG